MEIEFERDFMGEKISGRDMMEKLIRIEEGQKFIIEKFECLPCSEHSQKIHNIELAHEKMKTSQEKSKWSILVAIIGVLSTVSGLAFFIINNMKK